MILQCQHHGFWIILRLAILEVAQDIIRFLGIIRWPKEGDRGIAQQSRRIRHLCNRLFSIAIRHRTTTVCINMKSCLAIFQHDILYFLR
ncbi:hypothetical protein BRL93_02725 [Xanthomonas oryzae pv. oryzae]|nr:hypothetical protein BRL93_02725 [Xanthomonas oryzae pv. oryzae]RBJ36574.1 hypothetical protein BRN91_22640 [Xanthomonas oryzae pv. oryzae]